MADPKSKAIEVPSLRRFLPVWSTPAWLEAERWRQTVRNQPVAMVCRDKLIAFAQALPWVIRAKVSSDQDEVADDIKYYTDVVLANFDMWLDPLLQDALDLPVGGNTEIVRWPADIIPQVQIGLETLGPTRPNALGHPLKLVNLDGATLTPRNDPDFPLIQRIKGNINIQVVFAKEEVARIILTKRPEIERQGWGMAPPERAFLSLTALHRGDQYYANALLDTPPAGIIDLMDMAKKDAKEWVQSFGKLMQGIDPMKIGVLYEHTTAANFLAFGRPPTDMMFGEIITLYQRITTAAYWLTLQDIGLEGPGTLAGQIRGERQARLTGFGVVKEKTRNLLNKKVLPDYLEFSWVEKDDEALINTGRARLVNAQAMRALVDAKIISPVEGQQQMVSDGLLTVDVEPPPDAPEFPQGRGFGGDPNNELDRVPPSQGGRGDIGVQRAAPTLGDPSITAAPRASTTFDKMGQVIREGFSEVIAGAGDPQLRKLIKKATRLLFPMVEQALIELSEAERPLWQAERVKMWGDEPSEFDQYPDVLKQSAEVLDALEKTLDADKWWVVPETLAPGIDLILREAFSEGATVAAELVQRLLFEEELVSSPDLIGLNFDLKNPQTLAKLEQKAAQLVTRINDGSKFFIKRIITSGVEEGLASPLIAEAIAEGASVAEILAQEGFMNGVIEQAKFELGEMTRVRTNSIVNTEVAKAETDGRVEQWSQQGLTRKQWLHTGPDTPCRFCQANIDLGFVAMDFLYETVFGPAETQGPPAHPQVDHCHLAFDENELIANAGELTPWTGG